jgi:hypothetical protein
MEFLSDPAIGDAVKMVNKTAGSTLLGHAIITPGQPGWMEEADRSWSTAPPVGRCTLLATVIGKTKYPGGLTTRSWYPFYERP